MRPPAISDMGTTLVPIIDAALARGITRIVFLSLQGVQFNRKTPHHAVEAHLKQARGGTGDQTAKLRRREVKNLAASLGILDRSAFPDIEAPELPIAK